MKLVAAALAVCLSAGAALADLIKVESAFDVATTADRLVAAIEANAASGARVFARLDHAAAAQSVGKDLPPTTVVIFGNPNGGTPLMAMKREFAVDLPLRVLIYAEGDKTWMVYHDPEAVARFHGVDPGLKPVQGAKQALAGLTAKAAAD